MVEVVHISPPTKGKKLKKRDVEEIKIMNRSKFI